MISVAVRSLDLECFHREVLVVLDLRVKTDDATKRAGTVGGYRSATVHEWDVVPHKKIADTPVVHILVPLGEEVMMNLGAEGVALREIPPDDSIEVQLVDEQSGFAAERVWITELVLDSIRMRRCGLGAKSLVASQAPDEQAARFLDASLQFGGAIACGGHGVGEYGRRW